MEPSCTCGVVTEDVFQCEADHRLWRHGKRLTSVSRIIDSIMPTAWDAIPADKLENARRRGAEVDSIFCDLIVGKITDYPVGTHDDSMRLVDKLVTWFDKQNFKSVQTQVVLGCHDHGGVMDLRLDGMRVDLKATYNVETTAKLQVAGYAALDCAEGELFNAAILHVTERYAEPKLTELAASDYSDWRIMLDCWRMVQRRKPSKDAE